ncbi:hypothetical protein Emag_006983 [Eimeria magna]
MQSPPHARSRTEREDVVEVEPPHSFRIAANGATASTSNSSASSCAVHSGGPETAADGAGRTEDCQVRGGEGALRQTRALRKEAWKVATGFLRLPVERGRTQPPESLVAKMKGQLEDSPAVQEIWDEWPSPLPKLERQEDDIYLLEFPEVTAAPLWGTPSWTSFLTAFPKTIHCAALGQGWDRASPQSAPTSPAALPPVEPIGQGPLPPLSPTTTSAVNALGNLASQGWDIIATRCVWWTPASALEYRTARGSSEYRLQELQWVDNMSCTVAAARAVLTSLPQGQRLLAVPAHRMRQERLAGPAVTEDQV